MGSIYIRGKKSKKSMYYVKYKNAKDQWVYKSCNTTNKARALEYLVECQKEVDRSKKNNEDCSPYLIDILNEARDLANKGRLTVDKTSQLLKLIHEYGSDEPFPAYSLRTWIEYYKANIESKVSDSHTRNTKTIVDQFQIYLKKDFDKELSLITTSLLRSLVSQLKKHKYRGKLNSPTSTNIKISYLKTLFSSAFNEGIIERDVSKNISMMNTSNKPSVGPFTLDEVRILTSTSNTWSNVSLIAATTGLRLTNITLLEAGEIDIDRMILKVNPVKQRKATVDKKILILPILDRYKDFYQDLIRNSEDGYMFPNLAKQATSNLSNMFAKHMQDLGIPKEAEWECGQKYKRTFHSLRHTFNSDLANRSISIDQRKLMTGHTNDATNQAYTHPNIELITDALQNQPDYLTK